MTGPEHYRRAEELAAAEAHRLLGQGDGQATAGVWAAVAQTPAVLALAAVPLENRIRLVTCEYSGCQAARVYSLIRPLRTGLRWIRSQSRSATVRWPPSGTRWAMPWCGRAVL
jgi:hypothetical protein